MKVFVRESLYSCLGVLLFVGLNLADAWLTKELIAAGGGEANPIVSAYGGNMLIKGFLALAIALLLVRFGKTRLVWMLTMCMVLVVLWTGGWLLTYV